MSDSKIDPIVHHLAQSFEGLRGYVEQQDLWARYIGGPVKLVGLVASDDQDVGFINDYNFALAYLLIKYFKTCPLESLEIIKCVLVKLGKVEQFLRNRLTGAIRPSAARSLRLIHGSQMRYLLLGYLELTGQILHAVVLFLILTADDAYELAVRASEYYRRTLVLVSK